MKNKEKVVDTGKLILSDDLRFDGELLCVDTIALGSEKFALLFIDADKENKKVNSIFVSTYDEYGNCIYDGFSEYKNIENILNSIYDEYNITLVPATYNIVDYISTNYSRYICSYFIVSGKKNGQEEVSLFELKYKIEDDYRLSFVSVSDIGYNSLLNLSGNPMLKERYTKINDIYTCISLNNDVTKNIYKNNDTGQVFLITDVIEQSVFDDIISSLNSIMYNFNNENNNEYNTHISSLRAEYFPRVTTRNDCSFISVSFLYFDHNNDVSKSFKVPVFYIFNPKLNTYNIHVDIEYKIYNSGFNDRSVVTFNSDYISYSEVKDNETIITLFNINTFDRIVFNENDTNNLFTDKIFDHIKSKISDSIDDDSYVISRRFFKFVLFDNSEYYSGSCGNIWHSLVYFEYKDSAFNIRKRMYVEVTLSVPELEVITIDNVDISNTGGYVGCNLVSIALRSFVKTIWNYTTNRLYFSGSEVTFGRYRYVGDYLLNDDILLRNIKEADPESDNIHYGEPIYNVVDDGLYENK